MKTTFIKNKLSVIWSNQVCFLVSLMDFIELENFTVAVFAVRTEINHCVVAHYIRSPRVKLKYKRNKLFQLSPITGEWSIGFKFSFHCAACMQEYWLVFTLQAGCKEVIHQCTATGGGEELFVSLWVVSKLDIWHCDFWCRV